MILFLKCKNPFSSIYWFRLRTTRNARQLIKLGRGENSTRLMPTSLHKRTTTSYWPIQRIRSKSSVKTYPRENRNRLPPFFRKTLNTCSKKFENYLSKNFEKRRKILLLRCHTLYEQLEKYPTILVSELTYKIRKFLKMSLFFRFCTIHNMWSFCCIYSKILWKLMKIPN